MMVQLTRKKIKYPSTRKDFLFPSILKCSSKYLSYPSSQSSSFRNNNLGDLCCIFLSSVIFCSWLKSVSFLSPTSKKKDRVANTDWPWDDLESPKCYTFKDAHPTPVYWRFAYDVPDVFLLTFWLYFVFHVLSHYFLRTLLTSPCRTVISNIRFSNFTACTSKKLEPALVPALGDRGSWISLSLRPACYAWST